MLDHALVLKQYPRTPHTRIDLQCGANHWTSYEGRYTEVTVYGAMAATMVEVNSFDTINAAEPSKHELFVGPSIMLNVRAVRDEGESKWTPEPDPIPLPERKEDQPALPADNGEQVQDTEPKQSKSQMKRRKAGLEDAGDTPQ